MSRAEPRCASFHLQYRCVRDWNHSTSCRAIGDDGTIYEWDDWMDN